MDSAYLKQTVGPAITAALTDLLLHGHSQIHPNLSTNPETNPLTTSQDPITHVARYLLHYANSSETIKKDDLAQEQLKALVNSLRAQEVKIAEEVTKETISLPEQMTESVEKKQDIPEDTITSPPIAAEPVVNEIIAEPVPAAAAAPVFSEASPVEAPTQQPPAEEPTAQTLSETPAENPS